MSAESATAGLPGANPTASPNGGAPAAQPAAPAQPAASPGPWYADFKDPDTRGYVESKGWKTAEDVARSAHEAERKLGAPANELLRIPKADAKPEDIAKVYSALGKPETPDGYKLIVPEGDDGSYSKKLAPLLHKAHVTQQQLDILNPGWNEMQAADAKAAQDALLTAQTNEWNELHKKWPGDTWNQRVELAKRAQRQFGIDPEMVDLLEGSFGKDNKPGNARVIEFLAKIGESTGEHAFEAGNKNSASFNAMTPEAARAKLKDLETDREWGARYLNGGAAERTYHDNLVRIATGG